MVFLEKKRKRRQCVTVQENSPVFANELPGDWPEGLLSVSLQLRDVAYYSEVSLLRVLLTFIPWQTNTLSIRPRQWVIPITFIRQKYRVPNAREYLWHVDLVGSASLVYVIRSSLIYSGADGSTFQYYSAMALDHVRHAKIWTRSAYMSSRTASL